MSAHFSYVGFQNMFATYAHGMMLRFETLVFKLMMLLSEDCLMEDDICPIYRNIF